MAVAKATKAGPVRLRKTLRLAILSLALMPLVPASIDTGERAELASEARAALFTQALHLESAKLKLDRPISRMAARGDRVLKSSRVVAFKAGAFPTSRDLLEPGIGNGDAFMRTALAGPSAFGERISLAKNFSSRPAMSVPDMVMTASLRPGAGTNATMSDGATELAYAPSSGPSVSSRFDGILNDRPGFVPPLGEDDHAWAATPLDPSVFSKKEQTCLATGIYFEARGESERGQAAVAQVILNRVRAPSYPDTICGVVYQNQHMRNRCQFSFACDGIKDRITNKRSYTQAERVALDVTRGETWLSEVGSATHYHATYVKPRWARAMDRMEKIGLHIFYRTHNGGWN